MADERMRKLVRAFEAGDSEAGAQLARHMLRAQSLMAAVGSLDGALQTAIETRMDDIVSTLGEQIGAADVAAEIDLSDLAYEIDTSYIASEVADEIDKDDLAQEIATSIDMEELAEAVAAKLESRLEELVEEALASAA